MATARDERLPPDKFARFADFSNRLSINCSSSQVERIQVFREDLGPQPELG